MATAVAAGASQGNETSYAVVLADLGVDTTSVDSVIYALQHADMITSSFAAMFLAERQVQNAIPTIRQRTLGATEYNYTTLRYLRSLWLLEDPDLIPLVRLFIDSIEVNQNGSSATRYSMCAGAIAMRLLTQLGDFSRWNFLLQVAREETTCASLDVVASFVRDADSATSSRAYSLLLSLTSSPTHWIRLSAIRELGMLDPSDSALFVFSSIAETDPSEECRIEAQHALFKDYSAKESVVDLFRRIAESDSKLYTLWELRYIVSLYLGQLNVPEVLVTLQNVSKYSRFSEVRQEAATQYLAYSPIEPDSIVSAIQMVDSLEAIANRIFALGWVGPAEFVGQLTIDLAGLRSALVAGDSGACARALWAFQERIGNAAYLPTPTCFASKDAFRFLWYFAEYCHSRLKRLLRVPGDFHTIQEAVDRAVDGCAIDVDGGTYSEVVKITNKTGLKIRAIIGSDVRIRGILASRSNRIWVSGIRIVASRTSKSGISIGEGCRDITIESCVVMGSDKHTSGIALERGNTSIRVSNTRIYENGADGIYIAGGQLGPNYLMNNTIVLNGTNGISIESDDSVFIVNNIVSFNGVLSDSSRSKYGLLHVGDQRSEAVVLKGNLLIGNRGKTSPSSSCDLGGFAAVLDSTDNSNLTTNGDEGLGVTRSPQADFDLTFISSSPMDLHLRIGSPAIDRGVFFHSCVLVGNAPIVDFEGDLRPQGEAIDIGADERSE